MTYSVRCLTALIILVGLFAGAEAAFAQVQPEQLALTKKLERDLKAGEIHAYGFTAGADQFVYVQTIQNGIDVGVSLISPGGVKLAEIDSPNGRRGPEPIWFVTPSPGEFVVRVSSQNPKGPDGKYSIELSELRAVTDDDRLFVSGQTAIAEGYAMASADTPETKSDAADRFSFAAETFRKISTDRKARAAGLAQTGSAYRSIDAASDALKIYDEATELYLALEMPSDALTTVISSISVAPDQLDTLERKKRALALSRQTANRKLEAGGLIELGNSYHGLGDYSQAIENYLSAAAIATEIGDQSRLGRALDNMGTAYTYKSDFARAMESHARALEIYKAIDDKTNMPGGLLNIGNVYHGLGNYPLALEKFREALSIFEAKKSPVGSAFAISNIGAVYLETGEYEKALDFFLRAQDLKAKFMSDDPTSFYNLAAVYKATDHLTEAVDYSNRAVELCKKSKDADCTARALVVLSDSYLARGDHAKTLQYAREAGTIAEQYDYLNHLWSSHLLAARALIGLGKTAEAKLSLETAISIIDKLRSRITKDEVSGQNFFDNKSMPFEMLIELAVARGEYERAFELSERLRARTLLDVIDTGKIDISKAMTEEERAKERGYKNELASLNTKITDAQNDVERKEIAGRLEQKRVQFQDFQARLYGSHPELKIQRGDVTPVDLRQAALLLPDSKSSIVEFMVGEDRTFGFVITKDTRGIASLKVFTVPLKRSVLSLSVNSFREKLAKGSLDFQRESRNLYDVLIKPAETQLAGKTNLIIVPDGPLWDMPFQALQNASSKYLIGDSAIHYGPSVTALAEISKKRRKTDRELELLAFGNPVVSKRTSDLAGVTLSGDRLGPLPETEVLTATLGKMYGPGRSKLLIGADASESSAKNESPKYRVVQFATHGVLNNVSPMYSHLVLSQNADNSNEDGLLEAWEMKDLDLKADMVILSACDTARGKISSGEGVIGMTWALFIAGTPTTVASQWKVDSASTTELMLEFHRQLLAKKRVSKAEALRRASLKVMKMPGYSHPSYWAAFVIVGDGS